MIEEQRVNGFKYRNLNDYFLDVIAGTPYVAMTHVNVSMNADTAYLDCTESLGTWLSIDFGDGTPLFRSNNRSEWMVTHKYASGEFTATIRAYDGPELNDLLTTVSVAQSTHVLNVGTLVNTISEWAESFRTKYASEYCVLERTNGTRRLVYLSQYSAGTRNFTVSGFNLFSDSEIFVCFVRDFMENGSFVPPQDGDVLVKPSPSGEKRLIVSATKDSPAWLFYTEDPGRRTILVNTRRHRHG